jgi:hypothetical protein
MIGRALKLSPVGNLLLRLTEAGGDPGIFCYRMGVDLLSTDNGRFLAPVSVMARWAARTLAVSKRNQAACSNLYSIFSTGFSIQRSCRHLSVRLGLR